MGIAPVICGAEAPPRLCDPPCSEKQAGIGPISQKPELLTMIRTYSGGTGWLKNLRTAVSGRRLTWLKQSASSLRTGRCAGSCLVESLGEQIGIGTRTACAPVRTNPQHVCGQHRSMGVMFRIGQLCARALTNKMSRRHSDFCGQQTANRVETVHSTSASGVQSCARGEYLI